jgi:asparagine synthase (glutamine-hydrolysing)
MSDESGRYTIIFNGEIFNFQQIRQQLQAKGFSFQSGTDTEVLLKLYIYEGENCLKHLNGFFAFAIYDKEKESLFIARDRMGIKPLLYFQDEDKFIFASEMKALLTFGAPKELDYVSLQQYLQLNYIPAPHTIFKQVRKLLPGHYIYIERKHVVEKQYYQIPRPTAAGQLNQLSYEKVQEKLVELLDESVRKRLIADVPLGAFLSGGIDSS